MYIDTDTIIKAAEFLGALGVIIGLIIGAYKLFEAIREQGRQIRAIMDELEVIDLGLKGALEGLIEQGANGPCREALASLDRHLNRQAHAGGHHENQ